MKKYVYSLDFDGCLFNDAYLQGCQILSLLDRYCDRYDWRDLTFNPFFSLIAVTYAKQRYETSETFQAQLAENIHEFNKRVDKSAKLTNDAIDHLYDIAKLWYAECLDSECSPSQCYQNLASICLSDDSFSYPDGNRMLSLILEKKNSLPTLFDLLVAANQALLTELVEISRDKDISQIILMIGSSRQCASDDFSNADKGKGSCFPHMRQLVKYLNKQSDDNKFTFSPLLLADIYNDQEPGASLDYALKMLGEGYHYSETSVGEILNHYYSNCLLDESKISIIYAQSHHIAAMPGKEQIVFNFLDDRGITYFTNEHGEKQAIRGKIDILDTIGKWFQEQIKHLPGNCQLNLYLYKGNKLPERVDTVKGKGKINLTYYKTIQLMAEQCLVKSGYCGSFLKAKRKQFNYGKIVVSDILNQQAMDDLIKTQGKARFRKVKKNADKTPPKNGLFSRASKSIRLNKGKGESCRSEERLASTSSDLPPKSTSISAIHTLSKQDSSSDESVNPPRIRVPLSKLRNRRYRKNSPEALGDEIRENKSPTRTDRTSLVTSRSQLPIETREVIEKEINTKAPTPT